MKDNNIKIPFYVSTNNKHMSCLGVFAYIFNHFLPDQELRILGYEKPDFKLPDNCKFISMGIQGTVNEWSTDLRKYFKDVDEKYFIYGTEDTFFYKKPNVDFINYLVELIEENDSVGRINLVDGTEGDDCHLINSMHYKVNLLEEIIGSEWGDWNLYRQTRESNYSITTQFSIWNKDFFVKYLEDGLTPWEFETEGSKKAVNDNKYGVLMIDGSYPIYKKEGYTLGTWTNKEFWYEFLDDDIKQTLGLDI